MTMQEKKHVARRGMHYKCESCGCETVMWLEKGLEEGGPTQKPVPMFIRCKACGEIWHGMRHVGIDPRLPFYSPIPEGSDYFRNDQDHDCGIPVFASEV